jgi:hypothetical protein
VRAGHRVPEPDPHGGLGRRLAGREAVFFEELADEEVHENRPDFPAALYDAIVLPATPSGRPIRRTCPWRSSQDIARMVAVGRIVHPSVTDIPLTSVAREIGPRPARTGTPRDLMQSR